MPGGGGAGAVGDAVLMLVIRIVLVIGMQSYDCGFVVVTGVENPDET